MKRFRTITALVLALVLLLIPVMQASAAGKTLYISELRIGYGDEGKAALETEGFTVWTDMNANEGGNGSAVWLGYKTTDNPDDAITDIALMNMKGGYSFEAYTQEIEELNRQVSEQLASFKAAIQEFRDNYKSGSVFAAQALITMNNFVDDADGNYICVGDLLLDETTSDDVLHRIFLEGNTEAVYAIEQALALACVETGEDNLLTRLENVEYPNALDPEGNAGRSALRQVFEDFHYDALAAQTAFETMENYEGGAENFFTDDHLSEEEAYLYGIAISKYTLLTITPFGNSGMSLFEFAMLDDTEENKYGDVLEDEFLEMLASTMTAGQLGVVANVGIMTILMNAAAGSEEEEAKENYNAVETAQAPVSVYYGVDRSLFEDIDSIALTSNALREKAAAEASNFGKDSNVDRTEAIAFTAAAATAFTAGTLAVILGAKAIVASTADVVALKAAYKELEIYFTMSEEKITLEQYAFAQDVDLNAGASVGGVICTVLGCIAIIAAVVLTIFAILSWIEKPTVPETEYTEIPRVIVEKDEEEGSFVPYYAAKLAGAEENETDSTKLYGDLNALNGIDQWVGLYYTKNPDSGKPITTEMFISRNGVLNSTQTGKFAALHMFGSDAAANLNQYNTKDGAKAIYIFLRTDDTAADQSGSVFTTGTVISVIAAFAVGAGLATAITYVITRKKKSEPIEA